MMTTKKLFLIMVLLGACTLCQAQESTRQPAMPQGKLLRVTYDFNGMRMAEYSDFDLKRNADGSESEFKFRHYNSSEVSMDGVADSLFDAARQIIEEERMYEYASSYSLPRELAETMLDGFKWQFEAYFENGASISSHGRHVMPDGKGLRRIEALLSEAAKALIEATLDR